MKKLAIAFATVCLAATPVLACPHSDKAETSAPRTAEKQKDAPKADKAKDTTKTAKPEKKPAEKTTEKKPDKVSRR